MFKSGYHLENRLTQLEDHQTKYYNQLKNKNMLTTIKNILTCDDSGKIVFCGISLYTLWSNNKILKGCLSLILLRKLYEMYNRNKNDINNVLNYIL